MRILKIGKNDAGQRLDKFLTKAVKGLPHSMLYKSIRLKKIKVNRARTDQKYILQEGDEIQLFIRDEFFDVPENDDDVIYRIEPKIAVVYEDENILLCQKRPGVLVHEDAEGGENTLILHIKAYLWRKGEYDPKAEQSFAPALCNRIDRNTGGIVIAAKNAEALRIMNEKIRENEISKFYLAAVHGHLERRSATMTAYLVKNSDTNTVQIFDRPGRGLKEIITRYRVLHERKDATLVEVELITGRTHQIRAHFAHIGHPLIGDGKYGVNRDDKKHGYKYQALYSYRLRFDFKTSDGLLGYLKGKEVSVPKEDIWFYHDFVI
ncbi:MAG: RluA family pseudouridine synthase [Clostridia bacterium]|nr:RluA family pseudouridine synthase [Clostridia bacterium]